jgi:hypothetical protein
MIAGSTDYGTLRAVSSSDNFIPPFPTHFPLYYLRYSYGGNIDLGDVRDTIFWHLTYLSNYLL